jgi:hypothetical protein
VSFNYPVQKRIYFPENIPLPERFFYKRVSFSNSAGLTVPEGSLEENTSR